MDLREKARKLREQADAASAEASTRWDEFTQAREALEALGDDVDMSAAPEMATAQAAREAYETAAEASRAADRTYRDVLELLGDDAPQAMTAPVEEPHVGSIGERFVASDVYREVAARIPETAGSKQAIGTTPGVRVATREQAIAMMKPQAAVFSTPANVVAPDQAPGIRPLPLLPPLTVLDLVTMATTDSTSVRWVREKAFTSAAAEVAETTESTKATNAKGESTLEIEPVTFDVTTIAHWLPASKQSIRDIAGVRSLIDAKLEWGLRRRLAAQIINGNGNTPNLKGVCNTAGIGHVNRSGSTAKSLIEDLYDAAVVVADAYGETPNVGFVSRADYKKLRFARGDEGGAGTGSFIFGPPTAFNPIEVEGCLILPNFDLPAGMSVVGVWREYGVWMHEGVSIALSDSHNDYFIRNLVAILAELSCAAGAMETAAFCEISAASS